MSFLIVLAALVFLMFVAYRGYSVILFAPVAALLAVLLTDPSAGAADVQRRVHGQDGRLREALLPGVPARRGVRQGDRALGLLEVDRLVGDPARRAASARCSRSSLVCAMLTYGGVSLFVVVFAVYPFAAEMFRQSDIPKRLIPGTIALGAFTFTMDSLPGTPQIQNIIPTTFFKTTTYAAPWLGIIGSVFILIVGLAYLEWRRRQAAAPRRRATAPASSTSPSRSEEKSSPIPWIAILPLILVGVLNKVFTDRDSDRVYGSAASRLPLAGPPR